MAVRDLDFENKIRLYCLQNNIKFSMDEEPLEELWTDNATKRMKEICIFLDEKNTKIFEDLENEQLKVRKEKLLVHSSRITEMTKNLELFEKQKNSLLGKRYGAVENFFRDIEESTGHFTIRAMISCDTKRFSLHTGFTVKESNVPSAETILDGVTSGIEKLMSNLVGVRYKITDSSFPILKNRLESIDFEIEKTTAQIVETIRLISEEENLLKTTSAGIAIESEGWYENAIRNLVDEESKVLIDTYVGIAKEWNTCRGKRCSNCGSIMKVQEIVTPETFHLRGAYFDHSYNASYGCIAYSCKKTE